MQISTCLRPNIHQNGPKILRVNLSIVKSCQAQFDYVCGHGDFFWKCSKNAFSMIFELEVGWWYGQFFQDKNKFKQDLGQLKLD
jgi:hypothetical protein